MRSRVGDGSDEQGLSNPDEDPGASASGSLKSKVIRGGIAVVVLVLVAVGIISLLPGLDGCALRSPPPRAVGSLPRRESSCSESRARWCSCSSSFETCRSG